MATGKPCRKETSVGPRGDRGVLTGSAHGEGNKSMNSRAHKKGDITTPGQECDLRDKEKQMQGARMAPTLFICGVMHSTGWVPGCRSHTICRAHKSPFLPVCLQPSSCALFFLQRAKIGQGTKAPEEKTANTISKFDNNGNRDRMKLTDFNFLMVLGKGSFGKVQYGLVVASIPDGTAVPMVGKEGHK